MLADTGSDERVFEPILVFENLPKPLDRKLRQDRVIAVGEPEWLRLAPFLDLAKPIPVARAPSERAASRPKFRS